ncbi:2OG-Fe(II) oxygenase [Amorphus sp. 3PC139-8]|uniref:2OG-Fe(II) oxygenase n=1 Tax=Amorphus sp. 3PC139-8 TaxID=2735676 RepID=UPI00345DCD57
MAPSLATQIDALDWTQLDTDLDAYGAARTGPLLNAETCAQLVGLYQEADRFRSRIVMRRHGFGEGEYQYFANPLPPIVETLRERVYPHLAPLANRWAERLGWSRRYPDTLDDFLSECHAAGQLRPTPLLLTYGAGDYNRLHQDLYGEVHFPLQMVVLLSRPGADFEGGSFVLTEQKPRHQSRAEVLDLAQGEAAIFAVAQRPGYGTRGPYKLVMRHGVSRITSGARTTLGVIFHDAK